jgi:nicotinate-nucleotide adenylyltransferase
MNTDEQPHKTVAILGGSFDPPTKAHIKVASRVADHKELQLDEVWLMPAFYHPFGKKMVDFDTRLEMCRIAAKHDARIKVYDFEYAVAHRWSIWGDSTMKTATSLVEVFEHTFKFIIGMDNAIDFYKWRYYEELRKFASFIVVPRKGFEHRPDAWYMRGRDAEKDKDTGTGGPRHEYLADMDPVDMSSTRMRTVLNCWNRFERGYPEELTEGLGLEVLEYIVKHGLYGKVNNVFMRPME